MNQNKSYTKITLKVIEDIMRDVEVELGPLPYMKQISPGLWEISSGGKNPIVMWTGDGGAEEMRKAMRKAADELIGK